MANGLLDLICSPWAPLFCYGGGCCLSLLQQKKYSWQNKLVFLFISTLALIPVYAGIYTGASSCAPDIANGIIARFDGVVMGNHTEVSTIAGGMIVKTESSPARFGPTLLYFGAFGVYFQEFGSIIAERFQKKHGINK